MAEQQGMTTIEREVFLRTAGLLGPRRYAGVETEACDDHDLLALFAEDAAAQDEAAETEKPIEEWEKAEVVS